MKSSQSLHLLSLLAFLTLSLTLGLSGCGNRGSLYLPEEPSQEEGATEMTMASPETQAMQDEEAQDKD